MADGNYITTAQLNDATARQQNLWKNAAGTVTQSFLDADRDEAEQLIDTFIGHRYAVPVTDASAVVLLRGMVVDLVLYKGYRRQGDGEVSETIQTGFENTVERLKDIRDGRMKLTGVAESQDAESPEAQIFATANTPKFTESNLDRY